MSSKLRRVSKVLTNILFYLVLAIALFFLIIVIAMKKNRDDAATVFGYQFRIVQSASMEKHESVDTSNYKIKDIKVKSVVFIKVAPEDNLDLEVWYDSLEIGDVLTFKYVYTKQETITHRVIDIREKGTGYLITLEGDNKAGDINTLTQVIDTTIEENPNYIIGEVVGKSYILGLFLYALRDPIGILLIVIIPCLIIIILQIIKIVSVLHSDKKEKENSKLLSQKEELLKQQEEVRRQMKELEALRGQINKEE